MSNHLMEASNQWASRPADERFWNLEDFQRHCVESRQNSADRVVPYRQIKAVATEDGEIGVAGKAGNVARLTHWSFEQLCRQNGLPASVMREMPAPWVADGLNHRIQLRDEEAQANVLFHQNGGLTVRSINSEQYGRIWNHRLADQLMNLQSRGWQVPPARPSGEDMPGSRIATEADCLTISRRALGGLAVQPGDTIAPAGLYASDRDMFAFMVLDDNRIDDGSEFGLARGFFLSNSEVGNGTSLRLKTFGYRGVCGNHIVWNVSNVAEIRIVHRGNADGRLDSTAYAELRKYAECSGNAEEAKIRELQRIELGQSKDDVIDVLFGKRIASRKALEASYVEAEKQCADAKYGPRTPWGFSQGITAYSQTLGYADQRAALDRAAGAVLSLAS